MSASNFVTTNAFSNTDLTRNKALLHIQKWDGYNLTWLDYANEIKTLLTDFKYESKDGSARFKVIELVESLFRTIVKEKINSIKEFRDSQGIQIIRRTLESPKIWEVFTDVDSRVASGGTNLYETGYELDSLELRVSDLVKNIYHATAINEVAQVLIGTAAKDKNFIEVTETLINTFGRSLVHTASIPFVFRWTKCFTTSWISYQRTIRNSGYLKYQPENGQILIEYAKIGFRNSELGKEILVALRMANMFETQDWSFFQDTVDRYLDARIKEEVSHAFLTNKGNILNQTDLGFLRNGYFLEESTVNGVINKPPKAKKKKFLIT